MQLKSFLLVNFVFKRTLLELVERQRVCNSGVQDLEVAQDQGNLQNISNKTVTLESGINVPP